MALVPMGPVPPGWRSIELPETNPLPVMPALPPEMDTTPAAASWSLTGPLRTIGWFCEVMVILPLVVPIPAAPTTRGTTPLV